MLVRAIVYLEIRWLRTGYIAARLDGVQGCLVSAIGSSGLTNACKYVVRGCLRYRVLGKWDATGWQVGLWPKFRCFWTPVVCDSSVSNPELWVCLYGMGNCSSLERWASDGTAAIWLGVVA